MRRFAIVWLVLFVPVLVAARESNAQTKENLRAYPAPLALSRTIPLDVDVRRVSEMDRNHEILAAQREFDILSWQTFLALNWPADSRGNADHAKTLADATTDRVWGFWRPSQSIFQPEGAVPETRSHVPGSGTDLFRSKAAWRQHVSSTDENMQAFSGPLVDQNGNWVRYEVLVNDTEFEYLLRNRLYNLEGQAAFTTAGNHINFPANGILPGQNGAIEIKLAWKELTDQDDRSRFFVRHVVAQLAEPLLAGRNAAPSREFDAGLVGMHIAMRTRSSPEWVWATFEQVDNLRQHTGADGTQYKPSFNNGDPDSKLPVNQLPAKNAVLDLKTGYPIPVLPGGTATTWIESLTKTPVQVKRIDVPTQPQLNDDDGRLTETTRALNIEVQRLLREAHSVFQYYELIGTQWPLNPGAPAFAGGQGSAPESIRQKTPGQMVPVFLVNTMMETYFQKGLQAAGPLEQDDRLADGAPPIDTTKVFGTESCIGCHYSAGTAVGFKKNADGSLHIENGLKVPIYGENGNFGQNGNADFSWLLQIEAKSQPPQSAAAQAPAPGDLSPARFLDIFNLNAGSTP
jgi:hypothetical protein